MTEDGTAGRDTSRVWAGFDRGGAVAWSGVLRRHLPSWPGLTTMRVALERLERGMPVPLPAWAERARTAEALGFTPELYDRLHTALDELPPFEHPAHPDNEPDPRWPAHAIRRFAPRMWSDWPWLVGAGWSDEEATALLLAAAALPAEA